MSPHTHARIKGDVRATMPLAKNHYFYQQLKRRTCCECVQRRNRPRHSRHSRHSRHALSSCGFWRARTHVYVRSIHFATTPFNRKSWKIDPQVGGDSDTFCTRFTWSSTFEQQNLLFENSSTLWLFGSRSNGSLDQRGRQRKTNLRKVSDWLHLFQISAQA